MFSYPIIVQCYVEGWIGWRGPLVSSDIHPILNPLCTSLKPRFNANIDSLDFSHQLCYDIHNSNILYQFFFHSKVVSSCHQVSLAHSSVLYFMLLNIIRIKKFNTDQSVYRTNRCNWNRFITLWYCYVIEPQWKLVEVQPSSIAASGQSQYIPVATTLHWPGATVQWLVTHLWVSTIKQ